MTRSLLILMFGLAVLTAPSPARCADPADNASEALVVTADRLEMDDAKGTAVFSGNVLAVEREMSLSAERMVVLYRNTRSKTRRNRIHEIHAEGWVILKQGEHLGTAAKARYTVADRILELIGAAPDNPGRHGGAMIQRGEDRLVGETIRLSLDERGGIEKMSVKSGKGGERVRARISSATSSAAAGAVTAP
ncbi:MAG: hypothetical protein H7831_01560 [Magnetococcus sp. WYHC-3]